MLIALCLFSILFMSWLIYISLVEKTTNTFPTKKYRDPAKVTHDKLDQINNILEIKENPEKAE